MKFWRVLSIIYLCLSTLAAPLYADFTQRNDKCACSSNKIDPFEIPQSFAFGKFEGRCVNSCKYRNGTLIAKGGSWVNIANIAHDGRFFRGRIDFQKFDRAEVGFEEFKPGIFHVFLLFRLSDKEKPLILFSQSKGQVQKIVSRSIVISPEGVPADKEPYSMIEGFMGNYLLAYRLTTGEEMVRWTRSLKHPVSLFPVSFGPEVVKELFQRAISKTQSPWLGEKYQLITNNCSTSVMNLINYFEKPSPIYPFMEAFSIAGPFGTLSSLRYRNLIANSLIYKIESHSPESTAIPQRFLKRSL